jgi:hypothetical protein
LTNYYHLKNSIFKLCFKKNKKNNLLKKDVGVIKFMNQFKYLGLNFQNFSIFTAHIVSLKINLKNLSNKIF